MVLGLPRCGRWSGSHRAERLDGDRRLGSARVLGQRGEGLCCGWGHLRQQQRTARLAVLRSELRRNSVEGGTFGCLGDALYLHIGADATLREFVMNSNVCHGWDCIHGWKRCPDFDKRASDRAQDGGVRQLSIAHRRLLFLLLYFLGGGILGHQSARLAVSESLLCHNRAENRGVGDAGEGAIAGFISSLVTVHK